MKIYYLTLPIPCAISGCSTFAKGGVCFVKLIKKTSEVLEASEVLNFGLCFKINKQLEKVFPTRRVMLYQHPHAGCCRVNPS